MDSAIIESPRFRTENYDRICSQLLLLLLLQTLNLNFPIFILHKKMFKKYIHVRTSGLNEKSSIRALINFEGDLPSDLPL